MIRSLRNLIIILSLFSFSFAEDLALGSLYSGLGFGNSSTTLGHALSYVYSNEGISHGHALAFTTMLAHKFNNSVFYKRFNKIVHKFIPTNTTKNQILLLLRNNCFRISTFLKGGVDFRIINYF